MIQVRNTVSNGYTQSHLGIASPRWQWKYERDRCMHMYAAIVVSSTVSGAYWAATLGGNDPPCCPQAVYTSTAKAVGAARWQWFLDVLSRVANGRTSKDFSYSCVSALAGSQT